MHLPSSRKSILSAALCCVASSSGDDPCDHRSTVGSAALSALLGRLPALLDADCVSSIATWLNTVAPDTVPAMVRLGLVNAAALKPGVWAVPLRRVGAVVPTPGSRVCIEVCAVCMRQY